MKPDEAAWNSEGRPHGNRSLRRQSSLKTILLPLVARGLFTLCLSCAHLSAKPVVVVFETEMGKISVEVDVVHAPITGANFLTYVDRKLYEGGVVNRAVRRDNTVRHDVEIQVIQFQSNPAREAELLAPIPLERTSLTGLRHVDGALSMARMGPDTAQASFSIVIGDQPEMDFGGRRNPDGQGFAVFGRVVAGRDVMTKIHQARTGMSGPYQSETLDPAVKILSAYREEPAKPQIHAPPGAPDKAATHGMQRETRDVSGWTVHVDKQLLACEPKDTEKALELLHLQLQEIVRVVPAAAVAELRKVPLYFSSAYKPGRSGAEFHPDAGWLRENGRDPAMARAVEFSGVSDFEAEMKRMPNFALHELAHAYHFRVLKGGFANAEIKAAYDCAKASGKYEGVERWNGPGKPVTHERAYAMTDSQEYFAETTEAFFGRNDFFPFTRAELKELDPDMFTLLEMLWSTTTR